MNTNQPETFDFSTSYSELCALDSADGDARRGRGRTFERFLHLLLLRESLSPRTSFRPAGEEVDGSFILDHRIILLEAKWHSEPLPASSLYAFKGKVDGKLVGTIGIFISMSGFSPEAVDALTLGKELNLLLLDRADISAVVDASSTFAGIVRSRLRSAAEQGLIYVPQRSTAVAATPRTTGSAAITTESVPSASPPAAAPRNVLIICEGHEDERLLSALVARILGEEAERVTVRIAAAGGKLAVPRLANSLYSMIGESDAVLLVVDSDGDVPGTEQMIRNSSLNEAVVPIVVHPEIETWLVDPKNPVAPRQIRMQRRTLDYAQLAAGMDLEALAHRDVAFQRFQRAIRTASVSDA